MEPSISSSPVPRHWLRGRASLPPPRNWSSWALEEASPWSQRSRESRHAARPRARRVDRTQASAVNQPLEGIQRSGHSGLEAVLPYTVLSAFKARSLREASGLETFLALARLTGRAFLEVHLRGALLPLEATPRPKHRKPSLTRSHSKRESEGPLRFPLTWRGGGDGGVISMRLGPNLRQVLGRLATLTTVSLSPATLLRREAPSRYQGSLRGEAPCSHSPKKGGEASKS